MFSVFKKIFIRLITDANTLWNILRIDNLRFEISYDWGFNLKLPKLFCYFGSEF